MTLDERLEALTHSLESQKERMDALMHGYDTQKERMDALMHGYDTQKERMDAVTQTLEIVASMQKESEKRAAESEKRMARLDHHFASMMQSVRRLSNITIVHDLHIDDHEHRIADLETGT